MEVASAATARHEKAPGSATADAMVVDEGSACVVVSGSPAAKTASATPNSSAKKPAAARPKKAKDGTPASSKKAVPFPAASGLRGISAFLVCAISVLVLEPVQSSRSSRSLRTPSLSQSQRFCGSTWRPVPCREGMAIKILRLC